MSFAKARDLIQLALLMRGRALGVTIEEIADAFAVSRRTAERMRDAVIDLFGDVEVTDDDARRRHWRLGPTNGLASLVGITADEMASLSHAANALARDRQAAHADQLRSLETKIRAALSRPQLNRIEPDLEILTQSEGLAMRPGPRIAIPADLLVTLREAILTNRKVTINHVARGHTKAQRQIVEPYGFLYGNRAYLVAWSRSAGAFRLYNIVNIKRVDVHADGFTRAPDFSLKAFAEQSFGVFRGDGIHDVEWRFSPAVAKDAVEFEFHPTQTLIENADGSVTVTFRASGLLEMCWHLVTWADHVEIIKPERLKRMFRESVLERHPVLE